MSRSNGMTRRPGGYPLCLGAGFAAYLLSTGPVLGLAFWSREHFHDDRFYTVLYLYWPRSVFRRGSLIGDALAWYVSWWVSDVFHTVGPG